MLKDKVIDRKKLPINAYQKLFSHENESGTLYQHERSTTEQVFVVRTLIKIKSNGIIYLSICCIYPKFLKQLFILNWWLYCKTYQQYVSFDILVSNWYHVNQKWHSHSYQDLSSWMAWVVPFVLFLDFGQKGMPRREHEYRLRSTSDWVNNRHSYKTYVHPVRTYCDSWIQLDNLEINFEEVCLHMNHNKGEHYKSAQV